MALTLKFTATVVDKDALEVLLKDTTGSYSVSNTGGYGVDNSFTTPTYSFIRSKLWTDTAWINKLLTTSQTTALLAGTLEVTPEDLGQTGTSFADGVNQLQMIPLNSAGVNGTFTNGSKIVTLSTTSWNPASYTGLFSFISGLTAGVSSTDLLEVDTSGTNNTTQLTLKTAYTGTTGTYALYYGPYKDIKLLVNKAAEACIAVTLGSVSPLNCNCLESPALINKMIQWRFTADILFNCEDYVGAHNTLIQLNKICTQQTSSCNVHF